MEPEKYKKINIPKRTGAQQRNQARLNKARAYANEAPTIKNLYNAFINWFNGTKLLGGESDYITGEAPVGGRRGQILNLKQLRDIKAAAQRAVKRAQRAEYEMAANEAFESQLPDQHYQIHTPDGSYNSPSFPGRATDQTDFNYIQDEALADAKAIWNRINANKWADNNKANESFRYATNDELNSVMNANPQLMKRLRDEAADQWIMSSGPAAPSFYEPGYTFEDWYFGTPGKINPRVMLSR